MNFLLIYTLYVSYYDVTAAPPAVQSSIGVDFNENDPTTTGNGVLRRHDNFSVAPQDADDKPPPEFKYYGDVSLFYVGDGFFTVILIYPMMIYLQGSAIQAMLQ